MEGIFRIAVKRSCSMLYLMADGKVKHVSLSLKGNLNVAMYFQKKRIF